MRWRTLHFSIIDLTSTKLVSTALPVGGGVWGACGVWYCRALHGLCHARPQEDVYSEIGEMLLAKAKMYYQLYIMYSVSSVLSGHVHGCVVSVQ